MLETPHVAVGAAIATAIPNPLIAIPLAFASHFILEKVPHWNPHLNTEIQKYGQKSTVICVIDASVALALGSFIAWGQLPDTAHAVTIMLASFFSVLPDVIEAPYFFLKQRSDFIKKWITFQKSIQEDTTPFWGFVTQSTTIAASLFWIFTK